MATTKTKVESKKVTNLKITRNGNTFKAEWKNPVSFDSLKCKFRCKVNGEWQSWPTSFTSLSKTATSTTKTISLSNYFPDTSNKLNSVEVCVASCQEDTTKINYTQAKAFAYFAINVPSRPVVSATPGASETSFAYSVFSGADVHNAFKHARYWKGHADNWGTKDPATFTGYSSMTSVASATGTITEATGASNVSGTQSRTSIFRMNADGPGGLSDNGKDFAYAMFVYAWPYAAKDLSKVSLANQSTGYLTSVKWTKVTDDCHPASEHRVDYFIGKPADTNLNCPAGANWTTAVDYVGDAPGTVQTATFQTDARISDEECMWVRVWQKHVLTLTTPCNALRVAEFGKLPAPTIESISYNASTHALSVSVDNNCELSVSTTLSIGNIKTVTVPANGVVTDTINLGASSITFSARNTYGSKASDKVSQAYDPTLSASTPTAFYPTNVKAVKADNAGTVRVTWTNVMKGVTEAEVTVATSPTEWSKANPDFVETATVQGVNVTSATIGGLEFGATYYFKVRTTNSNGTSGYSASYGSITLSAAEAPVPVISLSETENHGINVSWSWNTWSSATAMELLWSTNSQEGRNAKASWEMIGRGGRTGNDTYLISGVERGKTWYVWARFISSNATTNSSTAQILLAITPVAPTNVSLTRAAQASDKDGETTVRLAWANSWKDTVKTQVSWDLSASAWNTAKGPANTADLSASASSTLIPELELGKTWYARVRLLYDDNHYIDSSIVSIDLRTVPSTPSVSISSTVITRFGNLNVSWTYGNEDKSAQSSATVTIYNSNKVKVGALAGISNETAATIYAEALGLTGNNTYYVTVQTVSANGKASQLSDYIPFTVLNKPVASFTSTSLVDVTEDGYTFKALQAMPLTMTIGGAASGGQVLVYVERTKAQFLARPDETQSTGFVGELVAIAEGGSNGQISIDQADLRTNFEENGEYKITAIVVDRLGTNSDPITLGFTVRWSEHAVMPTATYVVDQANNIVKITPTAGTGTPEDAIFEIYRMSADRPELIMRSEDWGTTYVDPYPALGEYGGHRVVCKTSTGDYTTDEGTLAWLDIETAPALSAKTALIDFDGEQIDFIYNIDVSHSWDKDFLETKYLGGSVQGDWNPAVTRKMTMSTVMVTLVDEDKIEKVRRLATHAGICHVRTPDGSSFAADIQISEKWSQSSAHKIAEFSMNITRVDSEAFEGMTLSDWEG